MRRTGRWVLNGLTALSVLLCVAAGVAGGVPFHDRAGGARYYGASHACTLMACSGGVVISLWDCEPAPPAADDGASTGPRRGWVWESFQWLGGHPPAADRRGPQWWAGAYNGWSMIAIRDRVWAGSYIGWRAVRVRYVRLGYGWLVAAFAILPATRLLVMRRRRRRTKAGGCARCGYDLTANVSGVCPECGMKIAKEE